MELSYSNASNVSLSRPHQSSTNSSQELLLSSCFNTAPSSSIFATFTITNILLLLPLSIYILHTGFQRWRKDGSSGPMNPTDVFTYHMVAMELFGISGSVVCSCGAFLDHPMMLWVGCNMFAIVSCIKMFFHVLTCVERYVAVVHPITYMSLSKDGGIIMRNISIGCVWLICAGLVALKIAIFQNFIVILFFCNLVLSLVVSSFCSISVLRVLLRLGPAEEGSNAGKVDKMKQRAFVTITAIMAVLLMRFTGNLVCLALASSSLLSHAVGCVVRAMGIWFCLPSSYVLPLLFLHRAEKIVCLEYSPEAD